MDHPAVKKATRSGALSKYNWNFIRGRIEGVLRWIPYLVSRRWSKYHSQFGQDAYIHKILTQRNGFFVEIGANDGITGSNTYFFETELGWNGICVEPIPEVFEALKKNRTSHVVQACISDLVGMQEFLKISGRWQVLSGLVDKYDPRHAQRIQKMLDSGQGTSETSRVPCLPLSDLLRQHNVDRIDLLSIDTEGGELDILKTVDFKKVHIDVITVENNFHEPYMREFLTRNGFRLLATIGVDEVYRRIG